MKPSQRTPGHPYRYIGPEGLREDAQSFIEKFEVDGDHTTSVEVRTAKRRDAKHIADRDNRSPLE